MQKVDDIFKDYKDLNALTGKTADEHIAFYRNKKSLSENNLFEIWKKLSEQAENFDKHDWTQNWYNWHKNIHAFYENKYEAKFLIQWYLTDVLEELVIRLVKDFKDAAALVKKTEPQKNERSDLSELIKMEVKRQIRSEIDKLKKKSKN